MSATRANIYASVPSTTRAKSVSISGDPKGDNFLYTCGTSVVIRNIHNPLIADLYDEHQRNPTCAAYAPSGFYIASGDASGTVRIWDTTQSTHILKIELKVLGSTVNDICWSADSQRIVVGGDGREKYGHAFIWDTGASVGEISGHSKPINSVSIKPSRPFRVVTGSEDFVVNWYEGPPFKYKGNMKDHSRFVNCVRFSPDGNFFASVGSDKKGFIYDGKTGEKKLSLEGHNGGIYSCSWSPDSSKLLTASGDKSCKIFDVNTGQCVTTFKFGNATEDQQLGCLWQGNYLLSVDLYGHINYLDPNNPDRPHKVVRGHNKFVTSLSYDSQSRKLYSGSYDSVITQWDLDSGETIGAGNIGNSHSNTIAQSTIAFGSLITGSMDDSFKVTPLNPFAYTPEKFATDSPVSGVAASDNGTVAACSMHSLYLVKNGAVVATQKVNYSPKSIAISTDGNEVAAGGEDGKVYLYNVGGNSFADKGVYEGQRDHVTALDYSKDGKYLATGCKDRSVFVFNRASGANETLGWVFHTSRINSIAFSPDSQHVATGSLDQNVIVWDINDKNKKIVVKGAHRGGVNAVAWVNNNTLASAGQDCTVKTWDLQY